MNTSILGDKIIVLWQVLAFGCILGGIFFLLPWFIGRLYRRRGVEPPSRGRRIMTCTLVVLITVFVSSIVTMLLFSTIIRTGDEWFILPAFLLVWIGSSVVIAIIVLRLFLSEYAEGRRRVLLFPAIGLALCAMGIQVCVMPSFGRMRTLSKRCIDGSDLNGIGKGLILYHDEHGTYPDDLRRLVDDGQPAQLLLSMYGTSRDKIPKPLPVPYDGPCDYIYIHLPADAPDDLIWVWQPVEYHDNEGGHVLFKGGYVRWVKAEQLKAEVARTHKWLETHPSTQPASGD